MGSAIGVTPPEVLKADILVKMDMICRVKLAQECFADMNTYALRRYDNVVIASIVYEDVERSRESSTIVRNAVSVIVVILRDNRCWIRKVDGIRLAVEDTAVYA